MIDHTAMQMELRRDEKEVLYVYDDSLGYATIGVGHCVDHRNGGAISPAASQFILEEDIANAIADLNNALPWWEQLDPIRQRVLVNMCFNLGIVKLQRFVKFLAAMRVGNWAVAAKEMQNSVWWGQVGARAVRLQQMVLTGEEG